MNNKKWFLIFLVLCFLGILGWIHLGMNEKVGTVAIVKQGDENICTIDLSLVSKPYEFTVESDLGKNTIRVEKGKIAVVEADCPDKTCVMQGFISGGKVPVVCLPHRLSITISDEKTEVDALSGGI